MQLIRFRYDGDTPKLAAVVDDGVYDLTGRSPYASLGELLASDAPMRERLAELKDRVRGMSPTFRLGSLLETGRQLVDGRNARLLAPVDEQEVWASGVTYKRSEEARMAESKGAAAFYALVYDAERPELFLKASPHRAVGAHDDVGIRRDSKWNVPEPELAVVVNKRMEVLGFTVGNDVSSRDIEGENPLYLPQAKVYENSCALGPAIELDVEDPHSLRIRLTIVRGGEQVYVDETNTDRMKRRIDELVAYLGRAYEFPYGAVLLTGTGIVPDDAFTLQEDDVVEIEIDRIGTLKNTVKWVGRLGD